MADTKDNGSNLETRLVEAQAISGRLSTSHESAGSDNTVMQPKLLGAVQHSTDTSPRASEAASDPALLGVQDKIIKLTREQAGERQQVLTSLKEEQRRLAALRKEIADTERTNAELKETLARTDLKKLREQKEALAGRAAESEQLAAQVAGLAASANRLTALQAERERLGPVAAEVAALEDQLKELRQLESTRIALQAEAAGLQPAAVVTERLRKQVAVLRADAAAAEGLQEQVAALSPLAEQLPGLKALYAKLQASSAEVRQLEKQLEQWDKTEALRQQLQAQLEELHNKVTDIEELKQRVEGAKLAAGEVAQLEARFAALQSVAARLPVLRTQHDKLAAQCAEVADLELQLAELKQQVALRNALQQQISILAPKAAGAETLRAALRELEAQVASTEDLERQLAAMRAVSMERRRDGASQFVEAVSILGLVPAVEQQAAGDDRTSAGGMSEQASEITPGVSAGGAHSERPTGSMVPAGGLAFPSHPPVMARTMSAMQSIGGSTRDNSQFVEAVNSLGLELQRSIASQVLGPTLSAQQLASPSSSHVTPRTAARASPTGLGSKETSEREYSERLAELEEQVRGAATESYQREFERLRARAAELVPPPPSELETLRAEVAALEAAANEALELQGQVAEMRALASQRQELQRGMEESLKSQLALLEEQARQAEVLERQVQEKGDVVARKHELEMLLTELEATAAEIYLLDRLVAGRKETAARKPELEAELQLVQPEAEVAESLQKELERLHAVAAERPRLEEQVNDLAPVQEEVEALKQQVASLEAAVAEQPVLEARLEELQLQLARMSTLEVQLAHARELIAQRSEVAAELAKIEEPAAEAAALKSRLEEQKALAESAERLEQEIEAAEVEVARVRTLEIIVNQLRSEISKGPVLQEELRGLNSTVDRLQQAEELQLRSERDTALLRVQELEAALAAAEKELHAAQRRQELRSGEAHARDGDDDGMLAPLGVDGYGPDEEGLVAPTQSHMARHQQLLDTSMALQQEFKDLKAVEVEVANLQAAIRALAPLAEQRAALQVELEQLQRQAGAAAVVLTDPASELSATTSIPSASCSLAARASHGSHRGPRRSSYDGPLGRGAMPDALMEGGCAGSRLDPEVPLPSEPISGATAEADAIAAMAQQRSALSEEVEGLRAQVADVASLRAERDALREVEAEVIALSDEIPQLAPYVELLPALRSEYDRLREAVAEAERLRSGVETMTLQLDVMRALREAASPSAPTTVAGGTERISQADSETQHFAAPAGPVEADADDDEGEEEEAGAAFVLVRKRDGEAASPPLVANGTGAVANTSPGNAGEVESSLTAVFAKMRSLENAKHELEEENSELRLTVDDLRQQLKNSAEAIQKLRGVAEALNMLRPSSM